MTDPTGSTDQAPLSDPAGPAPRKRPALDQADDVVLEASLLNLPLKGRDSVSRGLAAASRLYEKVIFTDQATTGSRQYLEWKVKTFSGDELPGVTILTRNNAGIIQHIAIHHRPLEALMRLSAKIGESLRGENDPAYFLPL